MVWAALLNVATTGAEPEMAVHEGLGDTWTMELAWTVMLAVAALDFPPGLEPV